VLIQALGDEHPPRDPGAIVLDIPDQLGRRMPETDLLKLHEQPFLLAARPGTPAAPTMVRRRRPFGG
jgi:hypothetical protein